MQRILFVILSITFLGILAVQSGLALEIPGGERIEEVSIGGAPQGAVGIEEVQGLGFKALSLVKTIISGAALLYIVLVGAYMIAFSDSEEVMKKQRMQLVYVLVGFLFLNVPGIIYQVFVTEDRSTIE